MQKREESMLNQEQVKELFDYDSKTGNLVCRVKRGTRAYVGKIVGCSTKNGYKQTQIDGKKYYVHRLVWLFNYGCMPKEDIDHINGIRLDNRIENLREATRAENLQNQKKPFKNNTSGFLGVNKSKGKWQSRIRTKNKRIYIGSFDTPEAAHEAYLAKKRELHPFGTL